MADRYYTHQNAIGSEHGKTLVVAHTLAGEHVGGSGGVEHATDSVRQVTGNMMRAYEAPKRRAKDNPDKPLCQHEGCKAFQMKAFEYCTGHARSRGLWSPDGNAG